ENRTTLLPKDHDDPHLLADQGREYTAMTAADMFHGLPPAPQAPREGPDVAERVFLKLISESDEGRVQAWLYNESDESWLPLCQRGGVDKFKSENKPGQPRVLGTVVRIGDGEVVFCAEDKYYTIRLRQSLADALRKPLREDQVKTMNLTRAPGSGG